MGVTVALSECRATAFIPAPSSGRDDEAVWFAQRSFWQAPVNLAWSGARKIGIGCDAILRARHPGRRRVVSGIATGALICNGPRICAGAHPGVTIIGTYASDETHDALKKDKRLPGRTGSGRMICSKSGVSGWRCNPAQILARSASCSAIATRIDQNRRPRAKLRWGASLQT